MNTTPEFISFGKIQDVNKLSFSVTQKLHGTNAQVYIYRDDDGELKVKCGSRNRWLEIGDDNYGFCAFVKANEQDFIDKLGEGRHFGEWVGPGINSGEGLSEKRFYLFNHERWFGRNLPDRVDTVPVLTTCSPGWEMVDLPRVIDSVADTLLEVGSAIAPGFKDVEGFVIRLGDQYFKYTFEEEDSKWEGVKTERAPRERLDVSHLLQPIRLEKLLSRDERYLREYPTSLKDICADYVKDLIDEGQITGTDDEVKATKKAIGGAVFAFIKAYIAENEYVKKEVDNDT